MPSGDKQVKIKGIPHRWKAGQSGNPKGRPKNGDCIISIARRILKEKIPGQNITWEESIALALIHQSQTGNLSAIKELLDRLYGRPKEAVEVSGPGGGSIKTEGKITLDTGSFAQALTILRDSGAVRLGDEKQP